jgi:hypothetical protein
MLHAFGYQLHICHQPNLTGPSNRDLIKLTAVNSAPEGFAERAPTGTIGKAAQQRSKLPDRRVEVCTLLSRVLIQAGFVAPSTTRVTTSAIVLQSLAQLAPHVMERLLHGSIGRPSDFVTHTGLHFHLGK